MAGSVRGLLALALAEPESESGMKLTGDKNQCPSCKLYFNSTAAFDRHRSGTFTPNTRRCLTVTEMLEKGMAQNARGWWISAVNPKWAKPQNLEAERSEDSTVATKE